MATQGVTPQSILKAGLDSAHRVMEMMVADLSDDIVNRPAPGNANPIGSSYAHAVVAEDVIVSGMILGRAPLVVTSWAGRTGLDKPMPMHGVQEGDLGEWYHTVHVDLAALRAYAAAVYAQTGEFLDRADAETLNREIDLSMWGLGNPPLGHVFSFLVIGHFDNLAGEVSAIKGVFGLKGYPF
jgi:hypothetical protein